MFMPATRGGFIGLFLMLCCASLPLSAQTSARLQTADTELVLEAGPETPRLLSLIVSGQVKWQNRASEVLIPSADVSGQTAPVHWRFNREASQIGEQRVAFVYDSTAPHLRLTWEWRTRQAYGPIEHQITIENLENQEIWIPMQDSLAFDWQVDPLATLEHLFVEKGADTPSPVGTHQVPLADGYKWTGTSSTYGDLRQDEPREIIPWSVQSQFKDHQFKDHRIKAKMRRSADGMQGSSSAAALASRSHEKKILFKWRWD